MIQCRMKSQLLNASIGSWDLEIHSSLGLGDWELS